MSSVCLLLLVLILCAPKGQPSNLQSTCCATRGVCLTHCLLLYFAKQTTNWMPGRVLEGWQTRRGTWGKMPGRQTMGRFKTANCSLPLLVCYIENNTGARGWLSRLGVGLRLSHDLTARELKPHVGFCADSSDSDSASPSFSPSPACTFCLSLSLSQK